MSGLARIITEIEIEIEIEVERGCRREQFDEHWVAT